MEKILAQYDAQRSIIGFGGVVLNDAKVVEITSEQWQMLLDGQSAGKRMALDMDMTPVLLDPLPPTPEQIVAINMAQRDALLMQANQATAGLADAYVAGLLNDAETKYFKAWAAYKLALIRIDLSQGKPTWPTAPNEESVQAKT